jgi:multiple antibiotic resistance protein
MSFVRFSSTLNFIKKNRTFIYLFAAFFSYQPIGTVLFLLTQDDDKKNVPNFLWTAVNVFVIMIISFFFREYVLSFSGLAWKPYV